MLCKIKEAPDVLILAVMPGDRKLGFKKVAQAFGFKQATFAAHGNVETPLPPQPFKRALNVATAPIRRAWHPALPILANSRGR